MNADSVPSIAFSFAAAVAGWLILEFVGRPFRRFFDLRGEVIFLLTQTANVRARYKQLREKPEETEVLNLSDDDLKRLEAAQTSLREIASRMGAFAENETCALGVVRVLGYNPAEASAALIGVSNTRDTYGPDRRLHMKNLATALKLKGVTAI